MITVAQIDSAFQTIIGWPYVSPGSNNQNGIDCSGAFVYAYQKYGYTIYHGSNRIIRVYCKNPFTVTNVSQLQPGMAILKSRTDLSQLTAQYKPGGQYYNPNLPYDYYHIGLVASVNPLQIINATTPVARVDTNLSLWSTAGYLNAVDYTGGTPTPTPPPEPPPGPDPGPVPDTAITVAPSGSTVNLRKQPNTNSIVLVRVPLGQTVQVLSAYDSVWWKVRYQNNTGYMMREFLAGSTSAPVAPVPDPPQLPFLAIVVAVSSGKKAEVHTHPNETSIVLAYVPLGKTVQVLSEYDSTWWQIQYQNLSGYMMRDFLDAVD